MTPSERNKAKVKRILDDPRLSLQLKSNIADGSLTLEQVISEVQDEDQRAALLRALTE